MTDQHAVMGQYLRDYQPQRFNHNRIINNLFPSVQAFGPSAVITQAKKFPDISFYQGVIDWDKMRTQTDAVVIRAGQNTWEDPQFKRNWAEAKRVGMKRGTYYFYDDRADPGRQADLWSNLLRDDLPEMECFADWENTYSGAFGGLGNVVAMMQRIENNLSVDTGMYTGYYFFRDHSNAVTSAAQYNYLKSRPLWLGWYTANAANVLIPSPWSTLLFWQFGTPAVGAQYGVNSAEIDMNYFNGTQDAFDFRYGQGEPTMATKYGTVSNAAGLNIRNGAGTGFVDIGDLYSGDELVSDRQQMVGTVEWWHLVDAKHNGQGVLTTNGQAVSARTDCWASGLYIAEHAEPAPTVTKTHTIDVYSDGSVYIDGKPVA